MRLLLILAIFFSLTQLASAERWRGLIASVAALESAKEQVPKNLKPTSKPKKFAPIAPKADKVEYWKECNENGCTLTPIPKAASAGEATETTEDGKKLVSPLTTKTKKTHTKLRFRLFRKRYSSYRQGQ